MIPELGHFCLILAFVIAILAAIIPQWGALKARISLMLFARYAAWVQLGLILISFSCLTIAFIQNDFSVQYVAMHSNTQTPLIYRITGVWGSHEGSMLLWALTMGLWMCAVALFSKSLPLIFQARVLSILSAINAAFLVFILQTSNPFIRLLPAVPEGRDLNPLLQDPGMIIHPPLLYMGYVGFSVAFAFALAALMAGRLDAAWARWSRPWTIVAWIFLTAGIAVGSGWAYYELGWGGWWFWDPVENASFMPWLVGTALLHSLAVTEKRGAFRNWTVLLAIAAFSLSLLGTFLVRSGVLTSVHAFATDPARGRFILGILVLVIGTSLLLFAWRTGRLASEGQFGLVSRETMLLINNVLLSVASAAVLLGTLYPLLLDALTQSKISVGPPYFEAVFFPIMLPTVFLMMVAPFMRWKADEAHKILKKISLPLIGSVVLGILFTLAIPNANWKTGLGLILATWGFIASAVQLREQVRQRKNWSIPRAWLGMWLAHLGVAIFIIGVAIVKTGESNLDVKMQAGDQAQLAGYVFTLKNIEPIQSSNYRGARATIELSKEGKVFDVLTPEKRIYTAQGMPMTEASLHLGLFADIYASMGEGLEDGAWIIRFYHKPFISWIWLGCIFMCVGGIFAVSDRRYRSKKLKSDTNYSKENILA